jgi:hypothetical protein
VVVRREDRDELKSWEVTEAVGEKEGESSECASVLLL